MPLITTSSYIAGPVGSALTSTSLLHFDGVNGSFSFIDEKSYLAFTSRATPYGGPNNIKLSTTKSKFGTSSVYFTTDGYLGATAKDIFGTGDFTLDFWCTGSQVSSIVYLFTAGNALQISITGNTNSSNLNVYATSAQGTVINAVVANNVPIKQWMHIMMTRTNNVYCIYVNGSRVYTTTGAALAIPTGEITMGWRPGDMIPAGGSDIGTRPFAGYIDELRIVKGGSETSAASFTVPSAPYTN